MTLGAIDMEVPFGGIIVGVAMCMSGNLFFTDFCVSVMSRALSCVSCLRVSLPSSTSNVVQQTPGYNKTQKLSAQPSFNQSSGW